jgi:hypothetical protein
MQIPPYLERLLLTNEAEFRNATLGLNGGNLLFCPNGKSLVILEMTIQPFVNTTFWTNNNLEVLFDEGGFLSGDWKGAFRDYSNRKIFQIQMINDKYNQYLSFTNTFKIAPLINSDNDSFAAGIELEFSEKKESLYIYADRSMYFNFLYYNSGENGNSIQFVSENYGTSYLEKLQAQSPFPITPENSNAMDNLHTFENSSKSLAYYPLRKEQTPSAIYTPAAPGQSEGFRIVTANNPLDSITIGQTNQFNITLDSILAYNLPLINVKYALVNKRPADYGLVKP